MANVFVVSAPSGAGKTSLLAALREQDSHLAVSVSHTTREKRANEIDGQAYHFVNPAQFKRLVETNALVEHAEVFGHAYGTTRAQLLAHLNAGQDVLLEIDWQGAQQVRQQMPEAISIFILPL